MDFNVARKRMVEEQLAGRGIRNRRVLEAMGRVPRHEFMDAGLASQAYLDRPLNIGFHQTISQPYMVALMTELLELEGNEKVLEIGTGSGYQTSVLAELARKVFTVERVTSLSNQARKNLYRLGYVNVLLRIGDGTLGWPEEAPFDRILVTAGAPEVPPAYLEQLSENGILIVPCGSEDAQELVRIRRREGKVSKDNLGGCRFVKLYGDYGWSPAEK